MSRAYALLQAIPSLEDDTESRILIVTGLISTERVVEVFLVELPDATGVHELLNVAKVIVLEHHVH